MELVKHETCQQYVARRLSEGWGIVWQKGYHLILSSPDGNILRPVDLRNDIETLRPSGAGAETNIDSFTPPSHWQAVDEAVPDGASTMVWMSETSYQRDLYALPASSGSGSINFIKIYFLISISSGSYTAYAMPALRSNSTKTNGSVVSTSSVPFVSFSQQWNTNPADAGAWEWADIDALQIGVSLKSSHDAWSARCTQVYVEVDYTPPVIDPPTVSTVAADNIEQTKANPKGNVTATGGENPTRYIDYDIDSGAPYANSKDCGVGGTGVYNSNLTGLIPGKKYYYRARAVNSGGTGTGVEMTFTTKSRAVSANMGSKMVATGLI